MIEENCPCCPNHCQKEHLSCGRGREYFNGSSKEKEPTTITEQVIVDLKRCGHMLHHNRDINPNDILSSLSLEEQNTLHELLSKINM